MIIADLLPCPLAMLAVLRAALCLRASYKRSLTTLPALCPLGTWQHGVWGQQPSPAGHPPAVDADRDPVIGLVAANVPDELQDGLDGGGHVVVRPVLVVEVVDGAGCLQEKSRISAGFLLSQKSCPIPSSHLHQQQRAEQQFGAGFAAGAVL